MILNPLIGFWAPTTTLIQLSGAALSLERTTSVSLHRNKIKSKLMLVMHSVENSWLLTRERYPDALTVAIADQIIDENGLQDAYEFTKHEACPSDPFP